MFTKRGVQRNRVQLNLNQNQIGFQIQIQLCPVFIPVGESATNNKKQTYSNAANGFDIQKE